MKTPVLFFYGPNNIIMLITGISFFCKLLALWSLLC